MTPALIGALVGGVALAGAIGVAALQTSRLEAAELREAAKDEVIARQADELAREKRVSAAKDATADELRQRLEADRLRDDEIRRTLDDAIAAARVAGATECPVPAAVGDALRRRLRK